MDLDNKKSSEKQNNKNKEIKDYQNNNDSPFFAVEKNSNSKKIEQENDLTDRAELIKKQQEYIKKQIELIKKEKEKEFANNLLDAKDTFKIELENDLTKDIEEIPTEKEEIKTKEEETTKEAELIRKRKLKPKTLSKRDSTKQEIRKEIQEKSINKNLNNIQKITSPAARLFSEETKPNKKIKIRENNQIKSKDYLEKQDNLHFKIRKRPKIKARKELLIKTKAYLPKKQETSKESADEDLKLRQQLTQASYKIRIKKRANRGTFASDQKDNNKKFQIKSKSDTKENVMQDQKANKIKTKKTNAKLIDKISRGSKGIKTVSNEIGGIEAKDSQELSKETVTPAIKVGTKVGAKVLSGAAQLGKQFLKFLIRAFLKLLKVIGKAIGPIGIAIVALVVIVAIAFSAIAQMQPAQKLLDVIEDEINIEEALKDPSLNSIREISMEHKARIEHIVNNVSHDSLILPTGYGIPELHKIYFGLMYDFNSDFRSNLREFYEKNVSIEYEVSDKKTNQGAYKTLTIKTVVNLPDFDYNIIPDSQDNMMLFEDAIYKIAGVSAKSNRPILAGSIESTVWFFLLENGFSKESIAGIMGNIYAESGFKLDTVEQTATNPGEGIGLIQWSFDRKQQFLTMAESRGKPWTDLELQLEFLMYELTFSQKFRFNTRHLPYPAPHNYFGLDGGIEEFRKLKSIPIATQVFCWNFESPNYYLANYELRESKAYEYFNEFQEYNSRADFGGTYGSGALNDLFREAEKHLGKPYVYGSNGPDTFDCSSFVCWAFTHSGVLDMPRTSAQEVYNRYCEYIEPEEARAGDLVFFQGTYNSHSLITHIGIYAGNGRMIHAGSPVEYTDLNLAYYQKHFYCFGRIKNMFIASENRNLQWPVPTSKHITSNYGYRSWSGYSDFHTGTDIAAPTGTAVIAPASGTVVYAGWIDISGNTVKIDHGGGLVTMYCHLSGFNCFVGQNVSLGDTICYIGSTGFSTGPHLHFEIQVNGKSVDPMTYY